MLVARDGQDVAEHSPRSPPNARDAIGQAALARVLAEHTYALRGEQVDAAASQAHAGTAARSGMKLVVLGLSLSSSWGNGHATTFRALLKAFAARGHDILFLERDVPWYAAQRDLADPDYCRLAFYADLGELERWRGEIARADAVIVGSYVPEGVGGRAVRAGDARRRRPPSTTSTRR